MTLNEYQDAAQKFARYPKQTGTAYLPLGLVGEAGEIANKFKKILRGDDNAMSPHDIVIDEGGDVLWYLAQLAAFHGLTLEDLARYNIDKLTARYMKLDAEGRK